jgi:hypothetical protein
VRHDLPNGHDEVPPAEESSVDLHRNPITHPPVGYRGSLVRADLPRVHKPVAASVLDDTLEGQAFAEQKAHFVVGHSRMRAERGSTAGSHPAAVSTSKKIAVISPAREWRRV